MSRTGIHSPFDEADAPLVVNPDAELSFTVILQGFQVVARWNPQVLHILRGGQHAKLSPSVSLDVSRQRARRPPFPDRPSGPVLE